MFSCHHSPPSIAKALANSTIAFMPSSLIELNASVIVCILNWVTLSRVFLKDYRITAHWKEKVIVLTGKHGNRTIMKKIFIFHEIFSISLWLTKQQSSAQCNLNTIWEKTVIITMKLYGMVCSGNMWMASSKAYNMRQGHR